jgi:hypothetical protein
MKYTLLGNIGLRVSEAALGTRAGMVLRISLQDTPCGRRIIFRDVFPNFGDVLRGEWMKDKTSLCVHCGGSS